MKIVKHLKSSRYYIRLLKLTNGTNKQDGQIMWLYFGKYRDNIKLGFFVRECIEFEKKFK